MLSHIVILCCSLNEFGGSEQEKASRKLALSGAHPLSPEWMIISTPFIAYSLIKLAENITGNT